MRKKFIKLQKLIKSKALSANHIEEHRDCDAAIAELLGWKNIEMDSMKEWTADVPPLFKDFECIGRCVIPKFTTLDYYKVLSFLNTTMKEDDRIEFVINKNKITAIMVSKHNTVTVTAPTIALAICKLLVEKEKK